MTLSPTRHYIIMIPFIVIYISAGVSYIFKNKTIYYRIFAIFLTFIFVFHYNEIRNKRVDPFSVEKIKILIDKYQIDKIYAYGSTWNLYFMKPIQENFNTNLLKANSEILFINENDENKNFMFISHRKNVLIKNIINNFNIKYNDNLDVNNIKYKEELLSNTEIDFSKLTKWN